jgi:flagellar assembly protein FliH
MTSSSESAAGSRVLRADQAASAYALRTPDLRAGTWTRLGSGAALGDTATEDTLSALAERTRATAEAQGYAVGWAKGVREAQAAEQLTATEREVRDERDRTRREAEHAAAVTALQEAAAGLHRAKTELCGRLGEQAAALAVAVTAEVLGRRAAEQTPEDVLRRALDVLPDDATAATLKLSPAVARHALEAGLPASVTVAVDADLSPADVLVELHDHVLDLRVERAVARVREALR